MDIIYLLHQVILRGVKTITKRVAKQDLNCNFRSTNNRMERNNDETSCKNTVAENSTSSTRQKHEVTQAVGIMMKRPKRV